MHGASESVVRMVSFRAAKVDMEGDRTISGYAVVFSSLSQDLGGWKERIAPSAVDRTLNSGRNVDALIDHRDDSLSIIGSTDSGLLRLSKDRYGLKVNIRPPDTSAARDIVANVKAGLVKGMSFRFRPYPDGVTWDDEDGQLVRTVTDMDFSEVSIVLNPAYLDTEVSARNKALDEECLRAFKATQTWRPSLKMRERMARV